jgi:hypothetical protein
VVAGLVLRQSSDKEARMTGYMSPKNSTTSRASRIGGCSATEHARPLSTERADVSCRRPRQKHDIDDVSQKH